MTAYSDLGSVSALYEESQRLADGINFIDAGGSVTSFIVAPPPPKPYDPEHPTPPPTGGYKMAVTINANNPNDANLLSGVRAAMVSREQAIASQLASMGVTGPPPARE